MFNYPAEKFYNGGGLGPTRFADFPVLFQVRGAGIFEMPQLIATTGPVYVADVFVKPSVARKELAVQITLRNSTEQDRTVVVTKGAFFTPAPRASAAAPFITR